MSNLSHLKKRLVQAAAICEMEGLWEAFGHISARVPGTDHIVMTPTGPPGQAKASDIITLDLKGNKIAGRGKPNTELPIHTSIYRVRDDVECVIHVHPPKLIAFSIAETEIFPMRYSEAKFAPSVAIYGEPGEEVFIDSEALGDDLARALGKARAIIIRGHGAVTIGDSIESACITAVTLEKTAEIQFMAAMLLLSKALKKDFKTPRLYERGEGDLKTRVQKRYWDFYLAKLKRYGGEKGG